MRLKQEQINNQADVSCRNSDSQANFGGLGKRDLQIEKAQGLESEKKNKCFTLKAMFDQDILKKYYVGHESCYGYTSEDWLV